MINQLRETDQSEAWSRNERIRSEPDIPSPDFAAHQNPLPNENEAQDLTNLTSTALSILIDEATSPNSPLSDESFVPSLIELENIPEEYSNDEIPIGRDIQIGDDCQAVDYPGIESMNPVVALERLSFLKQEEIEIELASFSTPPNSPHSLNDEIPKKLASKKKRTRSSCKVRNTGTKKKTLTG